MRIPTKFNGYSTDGRRLYNDPATAAIAAESAASAASAGSALGTAGAAAGTAGALEIGATIGANLAAGAELGGLGSFGAQLGAQAGGMGAQLAATPGITEIAPAAVEQASQGIPGGLDALKYDAITGQAGLPQNAFIGPSEWGQTGSTAAQGTDAVASTSQLGQNIGQGATKATSPIVKDANFLSNAANFIQKPSWQAAKDYAVEHPFATSAGVGLATKALFSQPEYNAPPKQPAYIRPYDLNVQNTSGQPRDTASSAERNQLTYNFAPRAPYEAGKGMAVGGPVETMSAQNAVGSNLMYPQANINTPMYANPTVQRPEAVNVIAPTVDAGVGAYTGESRFAGGGIADLGSYSDGGRLLKGPGDGVSDSIPAVIGKHQPARLADGEFVVPARIVSELGNGSTEAGARKLYAMMDRVQKTRGKTTGKGKVAVNSKADKHLPA